MSRQIRKRVKDADEKGVRDPLELEGRRQNEIQRVDSEGRCVSKHFEVMTQDEREHRWAWGSINHR